MLEDFRLFGILATVERTPKRLIKVLKKNHCRGNRAGASERFVHFAQQCAKVANHILAMENWLLGVCCAECSQYGTSRACRFVEQTWNLD
jgi:hypothetical protein